MKTTILIAILLISSFPGIYSQGSLTTTNRTAIRFYENAGRLISAGNLNEAATALYQAISLDPAFIEAYLVLGDVYNMREMHIEEMEILKRAVSIDSTFFPTTFLNIGVAAFKSGNYDEALVWFERYQWRFSDDRTAPATKDWIARVRFVLDAMDNPHEVTLVPMGNEINCEYDNYWPSVTADEQAMVFTVLVPRDPQLFKERDLPRSSLYFQEDFYLSTKGDDNTWLPRQPLPGSINTAGNEGAQTLSADGNWMFFTACSRDDGRGSCDIYFSSLTAGGWSQPVNLGMAINSPHWESQPTFSSDGKTLMFVSNRPGGSGGKDIWQATIQDYRTDGTPIFGNVINLGPGINSVKDENSPFLHHDNLTLYFSSDGWPGMGGMDLFFSRRMANGDWRNPVNLGYPINGVGDEIGLVINARGNRAYFSSDAGKGRKNKNIYSFNLPPPLQPNTVLYVKGRIFDSETNISLPASFLLKDLTSGETIVSTRSNSFSGEFLVCLPVGGRYAFKADHPGYMFYSGHFDLLDHHSLDKPYQLDIALQPIKQGVKMTLQNIFFETNLYALESPSKIELDGLVQFLIDNPEVRLRIEGHTDNVGQAAHNQVLSTNRAKSVYNYLVEKGIARGRLEYLGLGMKHPVADNNTVEGRAKNRRTEIIIL